jgi:hypothetical protein
VSRAKVPSTSPLTSFSYDDPRIGQAFATDISGAEKSGKSHFGFTYPGDIGIIETPPEFGKSDPLIEKFHSLYDPKKVFKLKRLMEWSDLSPTIDSMGRDPDIRTVIIDTGTHLRQMAAKHWMAENNRKAVFPTTEWQHINKMIDEQVCKVKKANKYLVVTNRLHDEWIGDNATGRQIRHGHEPFLYDFHLILEIVWGIRDKLAKKYFEDYKFAQVKGNAFWGIDTSTNMNYGKPYLFNISYQGVCDELLKPWGPYPVATSLQKCIDEAKEWIASHGELGKTGS